MCFLTLFVGAVGLLLYWLGFLDRPKFQVIESILGLKEVFAIVTTAKDEDYIDNNICTVLKATKNSIEKAIIASDKGKLGEKHQELSIASSYLVSDNKNSSNEGEATKPDKDDNIGLTIFLQDATTGVCHQNAIGFLVEASSFQYAQDIARKAGQNIQSDLGRSVPSLDSSECSQDLGSSSNEPEDGIDEDAFFQAHAVALGSGPIFCGRIPIRSRFAFYVARLLHWARAHAKYTDLSPEGAAAVACEVFVNGRQNPEIGSVFVDYLYLLDRKDRETVWEHLETPLP